MLKNISKFILNQPLKVKLLVFFLPLIFLSVALTGMSSYWLVESQIKENAQLLLNDTTYQTSLYLNDRFSTVFDQLLMIENSSAFQNMIVNHYDSNQHKYADIISLSNLFNDIYQRYFEMIDSIYVQFNNGRKFQLINNTIPLKEGIQLDDWVRRYNWSRKGYYWLNDHLDEVFITLEDRRVMSCFKIIGSLTSPVNGLLIINLKSGRFLEMLQDVRISAHGYLMLISPDNILYSKEVDARYRLTGDTVNQLPGKAGTSGAYNVVSGRGEKLLIVYNTIKVNQWIIAAVVPEQDLLVKTSQIKAVSLLIIILLSIISAGLAVIFAGHISMSIHYLSTQVKRFEAGDFNTQFNIKETGNELAILASGLTSLVNTVKHLFQKVKEEQEEKRQIELQALQSQINPHFLYNTMDSIKHLIDMGERQPASQMVGALIKFFRIGLSKGKEIISIANEIEHVRNYLLIQRMRYCTNFEFEFAVSEEILNCNIIKLTLQPLVENAIYHGVKNKFGKGLIRISGWRKNGQAVIEVYDDGAGMNENQLVQLRRSIDAAQSEKNPRTFGLRNVNQRLKLFFGPEYGLTIISQFNRFTRVQVRIPFSKETEGGDGDEAL